MFARYLLASICALSSDMATFLMLSRAGATPMLAAFGGYAVGLVVHWVISIRFVFDTGAGLTPADADTSAWFAIFFAVAAPIGMWALLTFGA